MFDAVLFDLDGTLADTAPDLGGCLNHLRKEKGLAPLPLDMLRTFVSQGAKGLLHAGFGIAPGDAEYEALLEAFLVRYEAHLCDESRLFDGIPELLDRIEAEQRTWGIVTNKRTRFTTPVTAALGLTPRTPCVVSGDSTPEAKPSPLPVLYACQQLTVSAERTLFVGDDLRDIQAGRAAGCFTVAVRWGYLGDAGPIETWGADRVISHPHELAELITRQPR